METLLRLLEWLGGLPQVIALTALVLLIIAAATCQATSPPDDAPRPRPWVY